MNKHQSTGRGAFVTSYSPMPEKKQELDTMPSDYQPPGVDKEVDYDSLEEALTS